MRTEQQQKFARLTIDLPLDDDFAAIMNHFRVDFFDKGSVRRYRVEILPVQPVAPEEGQ